MGAQNLRAMAISGKAIELSGLNYRLGRDREDETVQKDQPAQNGQQFVATTVGLLDTSVLLAYVTNVDPAIWHVGTLIAKILLLTLNFGQRERLSRRALLFLAATSIMTVTTSFNGVVMGIAYFASIGFIIEIMLTLMLVNSRNMLVYLQTVALCITAAAAIHAILCVLRLVGNNYGRYYYLGGTHPNLGGEINAIAAICAAVAIRRAWAAVMVAILLADILFLQARSAMLVCIFCAMVLAIFDSARQLSRVRLVMLAFVLVMGVILVYEFQLSSGATGFVSNALMVNDQYRGFSTGVSGRDLLWRVAIELFVQSPIFGHSLGYFNDIDYIGPHNILLFGLSQYGIMSVLFFIGIIIPYLHYARTNIYVFAVLVCVVPLFLFNDRIVNINPYPFILYVLLLTTLPRIDGGSTHHYTKDLTSIP